MTEITVTEWLQVVNNVGFPMMMTFYLLFRFEKRIESLEDVMKQLEDRMKEVRRNE
ncbi:YvrJ family protein [Bacillus sp. FJAT-47783]|uniref:YvrJ family protein n=1 Tax=Bacillus sp. FJAT-47783 TaxID=2922712 RepID=UPI001FAE3FC2|nr:YvrJ family protein [Bacillus sp. FJAT-47783]